MSHKRAIEDKKRNKKLAEEQNSSKHFIPSGAFFCTWKNRYVKFWRGRRSKQIKKWCNRRVRRKKDIPSGNAYRKASEFWWEYW